MEARHTMLFKISMRNIRRSVRDYAIYFVTLLIAVMVFYAFNSVSEQSVMREVVDSDHTNIAEFTGIMMGIFSMVVSLVLGFLVIYSNQLLIRRRKHEFGMYFTLGMTPGQVSRIILYETVVVGVVSLVLGLVLGVLVSQLLSFLTAALFGVAMPDYRFEFSMNAFWMTLVCFVGIYVVVAIFNVVSIRRSKLINLLNANTRNQKVIVRSPWVCLALFVLSLILLAIAYWQLYENGMTFMGDEHFTAATVLMLVGSLLFFFSFAGFVIAVVTKARGFYLKKLRPFTTRQVASKVNTSFASVWVVCILLFFAITTFATGMGLVDIFTNDIEKANPYDASIISVSSGLSADSSDEASGDGVNSAEGEAMTFDIADTESFLQKNVEGWNNLVEGSAHMEVYQSDEITYGDLMEATGATIENNDSIKAQNIEVAGTSQMNDLLKLAGKPGVELSEGEYLVTNNMAVSEQIARALVDKETPIELAGTSLKPKKDILEVQLYDFDIPSNGVTIIVPDDVKDKIASSIEPAMSYLDIMYVPGSNAEEVLMDRIMDTGLPGVRNLLTREQMIGQAMGLRVAITYLALYIGIVLLVATAAVLAVQLLSLTIDSLGRYRTLSRLGCDQRMLNRSLFMQELVYFLLPLALAACHSAWTISIMSKTLFKAFGSDVLPSIAMSAGLVILIYGSYLVVTYLAGRSIIKTAKG